MSKARRPKRCDLREFTDSRGDVISATGIRDRKVKGVHSRVGRCIHRIEWKVHAKSGGQLQIRIDLVLILQIESKLGKFDFIQWKGRRIVDIIGVADTECRRLDRGILMDDRTYEDVVGSLAGLG